MRACPITNERVDERAARLCALLVLMPLGAALVLSSPWPGVFLALDFGLRGFGGRRWSPLARLARWLGAAARLRPQPINAGPKAFAAKLGFGLSVAVATSFLLGQTTTGLVAGAPLAVCAALEGTAGYCVGCQLYQFLQRLGVRRRARAASVEAR